MADGAHGAPGGILGSQTQRCCFMGELKRTSQSMGWDPSEMGDHRRGGQGFELLAHAGIHLLCQESKAALTCKNHWGPSCLPAGQAQMYFFFLARNFAFGLAVLTSSTRLFSLLCLCCSGFTFSLNSNFFSLPRSQCCSPQTIHMTVTSI